MERYNIFNLIHKGLRASLYQTALELQQADFTSETDTEDAISRINEIIMLFEGHALKEDSYILPAIKTFEPSVVALFEAEHEEDERLGRELKSSIQKLAEATTYLERLIAGRELNDTFVRFTVFNLSHMAKEEDVINNILWRYYSDDEIKSISGSITAGIEPWIQDFYTTWMLRGINDQEASDWMKAIEITMPEIVFQTLLQKAEQEWKTERYQKITHTLTEGVMVA